MPPPPNLEGFFPRQPSKVAKSSFVESDLNKPPTKIARTKQPWDEDSEGDFDE